MLLYVFTLNDLTHLYLCTCIRCKIIFATFILSYQTTFYKYHLINPLSPVDAYMHLIKVISVDYERIYAFVDLNTKNAMSVCVLIIVSSSCHTKIMIEINFLVISFGRKTIIIYC